MTEKKAGRKQVIVLTLGILYFLFILANNIYSASRYSDVRLVYLISTLVQFGCMAASMVLTTFRKKIPALALTAAAWVLCLVNQLAIPYGGMDSVWKTLYYMLEYILLVVYHLYGSDRNRNSLIWCGLFIVATGLSVYEIAEVLSLRDLLHLVLYLSFYLVGYSPDKWYGRKNVQAGTQA